MPLFSKNVSNFAGKKTKKSCEHSQKSYGPSNLDSERKTCANTFPRVGKQTLLFEAGVCNAYASFYRSLLCYTLPVKLPCGS